MERKAYITNAGFHDYSSLDVWASEYIYVTTGDVDRLNPERLQLTIVDRLKDFQEDDYIVFSGSPLPFALSLAYLFRKGASYVRVLYWLRKNNSYFEVIYTGEIFDKAEKLAKGL